MAEFLTHLGGCLNFETSENRKCALGWDAVHSECVEAGIWFDDHDEIMHGIALHPLSVTCGRVTVHTGAVHAKLARAVAIVTNCVLSAHRSPGVQVFLIPSSEPRIFPRDGGTIERRHVNGGYCFPSGQKIVLVREEECLKVAVHEATHSHVRGDWPHSAELLIRERFKSKPDVLLNEMLVELRAIALCTAMHAILTGSRSAANDAWTREREWATLQARRVLHTMKRTQHTSVLEYVVLRAMAMGDTFEAALDIKAGDFAAHELTRNVLARTAMLAPEEPIPGSTLRFAADISDKLLRDIQHFVILRSKST